MAVAPNQYTAAWRSILRDEPTSYSSPEALATKYSKKWSTLRRDWPRRLLHIPTMTSVERQSGDVYRGVTRPSYNILSYTWGRWEIKDRKPDQRLIIHGVSWQIPAVDCFTPEQFQRAIDKMGESSPFAWIDIACIDQENYAVKMDEVGRQASIFANAAGVYVWLWTLDRISMESSFITLIQDGLISDTSSKSRDELTVLQGVHDAVKCIFGDWWFSSLWTLQESVLRQDALLLCHEGLLLKEMVDLARDQNATPPDIPPGYQETPSSKLGTLANLVEMVYRLYTQLTMSRTLQKPALKNLRDEVVNRLVLTGFTSPPLSNPNVQYAAAKHRKTMREEDRIYGIMAIYSIKVGSAAPGADPSRKFSFIELENEFASALNVQSPLLGQMFVHTERPRSGKTWQITQSSRVPVETFPNYEHHFPDPDCTIFASPHGGNAALIGGDITPLHSLLTYWEACEGPEPQPPGGFTELWFELDDYLSEEHPSIPRPYEHLSWRGPVDDLGPYFLGVVYRTATALMDVFGRDQVSVLRLGAREGARYDPPRLYGLVLLHDKDNWKHCQRLGLCVWPMSPWNGKSISEHQRPQWTRYDGRIQ